MTEKLLQYIWQFQHFNRQDLTTTDGEAVTILHPGQWNHNQGPDFHEGRLTISGITLVGSVELHLKTSDWHKHGHSGDEHYRNVVLHVVYQHDEAPILHPTIELQARIARILLQQFQALMGATSVFACSGSLQKVQALTVEAWKERLLAERLSRKAALILEAQSHNGGSWEETLWWWVARHFGTSVNADAFERVARSLSLRTIGRHRSDVRQLEALLLGQAGLLRKGIADEYGKGLKKEYSFLQKKWRLTPVPGGVQFLRMRPANFPTVRFAQLASLLSKTQHLFSKVLDEERVDEIREVITVTASAYWDTHYRFDAASSSVLKKVGVVLAHNVLVNAVVPVLFAYGVSRGDEAQRVKAIRWLQELPPEENKIVTSFRALYLTAASAFDSQALLQLKAHYCDQRECLRCAIGYQILKNA